MGVILLSRFRSTNSALTNSVDMLLPTIDKRHVVPGLQRPYSQNDIPLSACTCVAIFHFYFHTASGVNFG